MKRAERLLERVGDPENLRFAVWKAAKGKRYSQAVLVYSRHLETNLSRLREQILSGNVEVGQYRYFKVYEPKERQICASAFGEQVLHHALMNVCHDHFEQAQIFDSYASRTGKGTYAAIDRAKVFTRSHKWFLKLDVRKFFESIHHDVLKNQLSQIFKDKRLLAIFDKVIDSYAAHPERGLPIGNLTSQYFANHYLAGLDHFIKERLRIKSYVRYMDDMVLWHSDKAELQKARGDIRHFVETKLRCELKPEALNRAATGLPFLGYHIFPHHIRLLQKSKQRFIKKMRLVDENYHSGTWCEAKCQRHALPLLAFASHADTQRLKENLLLHLKGQSP
ncbi:MAG TPA: reverse transcriptase domain-containing protein [Saprospiraceae bacterium]|nr:reverse transcriptase domain-containing protein [Saprospiraceae bacterium]